MPFIATWKYEPSWRNGRKKSTETRITNNTAATPSVGPLNTCRNGADEVNAVCPWCTYCQSAVPMPAAAPPYATTSIAVSERSWICNTRIVITRKSSAFLSICSAARASASKVLSVSSPCRLSRNTDPMSVYLPQYFLNVFAVVMAMAPTITMMSGAQTSSTTAVGMLSGAIAANSVSGARIAKPSCGRNNSKKLWIWSTPSPVSCTTSAVRARCAYDGPRRSILR